MINKFKKPVLLLLMLGLMPVAVQAHRSWMAPSSSQLEGKEPWVTIDGSVSENLFDLDTTALRLDNLTVLGPDGATVRPEYQFTGKLRSSFDLKLAKPGTYKASIVNQGVTASYKLKGENKRWRGTEQEIATAIPADAEDVQITRTHTRLETYVSAGKPNDTVLKPTGMGLELVPITHPNELIAGEAAKFKFLLDGKPMPDLEFSAVLGGVRYSGLLTEVHARTDAKGEFSIAWPEAGLYWLNASYPPRPDEPEAPMTAQSGGSGQQSAAGVHPQPSPRQPERRVSYSGTFEVLPE